MEGGVTQGPAEARIKTVGEGVKASLAKLESFAFAPLLERRVDSRVLPSGAFGSACPKCAKVRAIKGGDGYPSPLRVDTYKVLGRFGQTAHARIIYERRYRCAECGRVYSEMDLAEAYLSAYCAPLGEGGRREVDLDEVDIHSPEFLMGF